MQNKKKEQNYVLQEKAADLYYANSIAYLLCANLGNCLTGIRSKNDFPVCVNANMILQIFAD
jgi:hypothetical protein